jgi:hypothetical protein
MEHILKYLKNIFGEIPFFRYNSFCIKNSKKIYLPLGHDGSRLIAFSASFNALYFYKKIQKTFQ